MLKQQGMDNLLSESHMSMPSLNSVLKISLGLIFVAILSSTFVYAESTSVNVEGNNFDIEYTADGVTVSGVEPDLDFISLIIYGAAAEKISIWLKANPKVINTISACALLIIAIAVAFFQ